MTTKNHKAWSVCKSQPCLVTGNPAGFHVLDEMEIAIAHVTDESHAQLIASAPDLLRQRDELLAALKAVVDSPGQSIPQPAMDQARAAIAQAEKGQP